MNNPQNNNISPKTKNNSTGTWCTNINCYLYEAMLKDLKVKNYNSSSTNRKPRVKPTQVNPKTEMNQN